MSWLVKINIDDFEIWTDARHTAMLMKCEYYGAAPFWTDIQKLEPLEGRHQYRYEPGEIVPYMQIENTERFALITELLTEKGVQFFKGFDIASHVPVSFPRIA